MSSLIRRASQTAARCAAATLLVLASLARPAAAETAAPHHSDLGGRWILNSELTAQLARDQGGRSAGLPGGGQGGRHRHGEGAPSGDRSGEGSGRPSQDRPDADRFVAPQALVVAEQGGLLTIADDAGRRQALSTDGRKIHTASGPWGPADVQARWDTDGDLQIEVKPEKGSMRLETYSVAHDRKHLYVTVTLASGWFGGQRQIVRAYDPATPPAAAEPAASPSPIPSAPPPRPAPISRPVP